MSTWTETVTYIKSQLRPGVLGNTNVQKILNAVLAVIQQINAGDFSPTPDALWKADVTYAADIQPVLWQDQWLVSNVTDNLGNVPISTTGVVHPSWRVIGSSAGSGIRFWQAIVYPNTLEIIFQDGQLYYLDRGVVGIDPFVSVDFGVELGEEKWVALLEIPEHNFLGGIQGGDSEENEYFHLTAEQLQKVLDLEDTELVDGVTVQGTTEFSTPTSLNVNLWEWNNEGVEQAGGLETLDPILGTPVDYNRVDLLVGGDENDYLYVAGDENIDQEIDPEIPAGYILLSRFLRQPDGTNTATPGGGGGGNFVSKSAGGTQSIKSEFAVKPLAGGQFDYLRTDPNGKLQVVRGDKASVRTTVQGSVGWARAIRINCDFSVQLNYGMTLELSAVESNDYQTAKLAFYIRFDGAGVIQDSSCLLFGKVTPDRYKIVKITTDIYELWLQHFTSLTLYVWRPLFSFGSIDRYTLYNREAITSIPAGDQLDFIDANDLSEILSDITALETWMMDLDNRVDDHEDRIVDLEMNSGPSLPPGGTVGQVLKKQSAADGDADWENESGAAGGDYLTPVPFSSIVLMTGNFKSVHTQTGPIAYTLSSSSPSTNFGNRTEHYITANNTGGKPTFSASFVKMLDNWNNASNARNLIIFKILPNGLCAYWIYDVTQL